MAKINSNYLLLPNSYLFAEIARKVNAYMQANPKADIIKMGIGDVTMPLTPAVTCAMEKAVKEMGEKASFRGYGPEQGYDFLIEAVIKGEYKSRNIDISKDEIFISDGSKCDVANIQEIFDINSTIAIADPVYPVYLDSNVMAGRSGALNSDGYFEKIIYMPSTKENNFKPDFPKRHADLIYICSPNNPTGAALTKEELKAWVDYALENNSIILYDSAYSAYIQEENVCGSIYEISEARKCAIEFKSFSKTAGFTGIRCAFTVVPKELYAFDDKGNKVELNKLWNRRQTTKFNGVSYVTQRAAEAVYSIEGMKETKEVISYYMDNAKIILDGLKQAGFEAYGGVNAPYIWWKIPNNIKSFDFLDILLNKYQIVGTPGSGFGPSGEGYFRLTAFGNKEKTKEAMQRIIKGGF